AELVSLKADAMDRKLRTYSKGMLQRIGLAQALLSRPRMVILDEPMSGLDPIGRREVRGIILELRDEGRTVLFSSHILSDAELLCSRVAILSGGRLVASGSLAELTAQGARGADLVVANLSPAGLAAVGSRARVTAIADGRYNIELPPDLRPEGVIAELAASGANLVSVTPLRVTLEDVFMRVLEDDAAAARARAVQTR
ncbi:MAG: ABC transporter ATP-binding protein, partial [Acidobacteriota bacterium]